MGDRVDLESDKIGSRIYIIKTQCLVLLSNKFYRFLSLGFYGKPAKNKVRNGSN